jgi:hypothetical protein
VLVSKAARSVFVFGVYVEGLALVLIFAPNRLLALFGVAPTHEVWIRVLGVLVLNTGVYYLLAGRCDFRPIIIASVPVRFGLMLFFVSFVLLDYGKPAILLFGALDVLTAIWTVAALRADARADAKHGVKDGAKSGA